MLSCSIMMPMKPGSGQLPSEGAGKVCATMYLQKHWMLLDSGVRPPRAIGAQRHS